MLAGCPSSCNYLEKPEAVLTCAATATYTCNGSKVKLGACDAAQDAFMKRLIAQRLGADVTSAP